MLVGPAQRILIIRQEDRDLKAAAEVPAAVFVAPAAVAVALMSDSPPFASYATASVGSAPGLRAARKPPVYLDAGAVGAGPEPTP